jgi:hypothetical protein
MITVNSYIHVYGQDSNHSPAHIIGTRDELLKLCLTIQKSLYAPSELDTYAADGEGYFIRVIALDDDTYDKIPIPSQYMTSYGPRKHWPDVWDLWGLWRKVCKWYGIKT